jgi:hypothetical protein
VLSLSLRTAVLAARSPLPLSLHPSPFLKLLSLNPNLMHTPISIIFWIQPYSSSQLALRISPLSNFSPSYCRITTFSMQRRPPSPPPPHSATALSHLLGQRALIKLTSTVRPSVRPPLPPHNHRRQPPVHRWIKKSLSLSRAPSLAALSLSLARLRRLYYFLID